MPIDNLLLFVLAGFLLNITPGPDMALIISRSSNGERKSGLAAAFGVGAGSVFHIGFAALGWSAIVMSSAIGFTVIKIIGGLYLLGLGLYMIFTSSKPHHKTQQPKIPHRHAVRQSFLQGLLTNILNPKVAIFFLAFIPQFIDETSDQKTLAFIALGFIFIGVGTVWNVGVALFAAKLSTFSPLGHAKLWLSKLIGAVFVGLGLKLALSDLPMDASTS